MARSEWYVNLYRDFDKGRWITKAGVTNEPPDPADLDTTIEIFVVRGCPKPHAIHTLLEWLATGRNPGMSVTSWWKSPEQERRLSPSKPVDLEPLATGGIAW